jgi:putative solute:sodium symporter small subunit|tara:strand:- start:503 stop:769 length:267 start_codon:yes stop_codon:yes gene_type:complete
MEVNSNEQKHYWKVNIRIMSILLSIWFLVSFGFSIIFVDKLNELNLFGFKFGFWWAQQGSIFTFVLLVFVYSILMNRVDREYQEEIKE